MSLEDGQTPHDRTGASPPSGSCWTSRRLELWRWLQRNAPSLAELYQGAVILLYESPLPGRTRFISHAVREIRNRLPDIICGPVGQRLDYKSRMDTLVVSWRKNGFSLDYSVLSGGRGSDGIPNPDISIPRNLFEELTDLLRHHAEARQKPFDAASRLFQALAPGSLQNAEPLYPRLAQWLEVTNRFMARAHDSGQVDLECDETELRRYFELFETTLGALIQAFFETTQEIDEILEDTNR